MPIRAPPDFSGPTGLKTPRGSLKCAGLHPERYPGTAHDEFPEDDQSEPLVADLEDLLTHMTPVSLAAMERVLQGEELAVGDVLASVCMRNLEAMVPNWRNRRNELLFVVLSVRGYMQCGKARSVDNVRAVVRQHLSATARGAAEARKNGGPESSAFGANR